MKAFAILHKPSGSFLPLGRNGKRGFTYVRPDGDKLPRLFSRRSAAQSALKWWLGGPAIMRWYAEEGPELAGQKHDPDRRAEEMEIVELTLAVSE